MNSPSKSRRSQIERAAETQSVLVRAAVSLLSEVGYSKTTTQAVAKQAAMTTGALHHHFPTKDDLMLAVLDQSAITVEERVESLNAMASPVGEVSVRDVVDNLWDIYGRPDYWAVWEIIIGTRSAPGIHGRVIDHRTQSMANAILPWLKRIESLNRNKVSPSVTTSDMAVEIFEFMLITIRGLSLERFLDKDTEYFDRHLAVLADFVSFRLAGLNRLDEPAGT